MATYPRLSGLGWSEVPTNDHYVVATNLDGAICYLAGPWASREQAEIYFDGIHKAAHTAITGWGFAEDIKDYDIATLPHGTPLPHDPVIPASVVEQLHDESSQ